MAINWHYSLNGKKCGPVSSAELKRLAETGAISPSDLIWKEGLPAWVAASNVKGLFATLPPPAPTSPALPPELPSQQLSQMPAATTAVVGGVGSLPLHTQRAGIAVASFLGAAATFMPWANMPVVGAIDGTAGDGWITLVLFAIALAVSVYGNRLQPIGGWPQLTAIALPAIAGLIGLWKILQVNGIASGLRAKADSVTLGGAMAGLAAQAIRPKFGLYMLVMAGAAAAIAAVVLHPQRVVLPSRLRFPAGIPLPRSIPLPLHVQRIAVVLFSLVGVAAIFMPWLQAVDSDAVLKIDVARSTPSDIAEAGTINRKYASEMGRQMGKKAELLGDAQSAMGLRVSGGLASALFATALGFGFYGVRSRAITGWVRFCVIVPALLASGIGLWEFLTVGSKDQAVRNAVQEFVRERGHDIELQRLKSPVMKAGVGPWVVLVAGAMTAAAVPLLASRKSSRD